jgi:hypothetical protein
MTPTDQADRILELEQENARLRAELDRTKRVANIPSIVLPSKIKSAHLCCGKFATCEIPCLVREADSEGGDRD